MQGQYEHIGLLSRESINVALAEIDRPLGFIQSDTGP